MVLDYLTEKEKLVFYFAYDAHIGQKRKYTYEDYINHPFRIALEVKKIGLPTEAVMASLLHDVIEDTKITLEELNKFLKENSIDFLVSKMVEELTDEFTI